MQAASLPRVLVLFALITPAADARVVRLTTEHRDLLLDGKPFGLAGPYEKLSGKVLFALDPSAAVNAGIVDLALAPRNAKGEVEFTADFMLILPTDPARGNGRLLYEVGNRGGKGMLRVFQKAAASSNPTTAAEFGDGALMNQGYALLWMGWQWDVPDGRMRMDLPVATDHGAPIIGLVRGNFVPNSKSGTGPLADRGHKAYPVNNRNDPEAFMTVRDRPLDAPHRIARDKWRFVDDGTVALDGGFELGRIYDVVYRARDPRVLGCGLAGTRDLISYLKYSKAAGNPLGNLRAAYGWGVSQSGRFLRHFLYQEFNQDEQGRQMFDGVIDEVGGAGRGSFNHRFGQASRDAEQFFNIMFPVDMFPFTDGPETDPETGQTDAMLAKAEAAHVAPKLFHIFSNSEYFNRAGSLIHTDPEGKRDIDPPANVRIYAIASGPHFFGRFPPVPSEGLAAPLSPLDRGPVVRALLRDMDAWVIDGAPPPANCYPRISDGTLTTREKAGWPSIPGVKLPPPMLITYRLDFGPQWSKGIVSYEPPKIGKPFVGLVPAVDEDGNARAGIRVPFIQAPIATYSGWNFRTPDIGSSDQLNGESGSFYPFARTRAERARDDSRRSVEERYTSKEQYLGKIMAAARQLIHDRLWLVEDLPDLIDQASVQYDWAVSTSR
jgi:hypothetical protein